MRKLIASLLLFTAISTPVLAEESKEETETQTYSFYVVYHSQTGKDYWAVTQDGSRSLWFTEKDVQGELLQEKDTFKATFDESGRLQSVQKYILQ